MPNYQFERECRTPYSEAYVITDEEQQVGRVDLHFTPTTVHATLCVVESVTEDGIHELIEVIDEELVMSADVPREDFVVTVYQGRESGIFSDEDFEEDLEENGN